MPFAFGSYACYTALLPDLVPSSHLGRASGTMATMSMLGALFGFSLFGFLLQTVHAYAIYCLVIICTVGLTCLVAREKARDEAPPWSAAELISAYSIDVVTYAARSDPSHAVPPRARRPSPRAAELVAMLTPGAAIQRPTPNAHRPDGG